MIINFLSAGRNNQRKYCLFSILIFSNVSMVFSGMDTSLTAQAITNAMYRVNTWTVNHPYVANDRNWIRATWYTGVMGLYRSTKDTAILHQALNWAMQQNWQTGTETSGSNKLTCCQTYMELFFVYNDSAMFAPFEKWVNTVAPNSPACNCLTWWYEGGRSYADALYVGPPALAMLAKATGKDKYIGYINGIYWTTINLLFDKTDSLVYRDASYIGKLDTNGKKIFWSRGNGWVMGSIPRLLKYLPAINDTLNKRNDYIALFKKLSPSIARRQCSDGFWRANLADSSQYPGPESSGTAFFNFALAWGINNGILDYAGYFPVVKKAWQALVGKAIQSDGRLGYVQPVGASPALTDSTKTHEYGVGAFLLAGEEMKKLAEKTSVFKHNALPGTISSATEKTVLFSPGTAKEFRWFAHKNGLYSLCFFNVQGRKIQEIEMMGKTGLNRCILPAMPLHNLMVCRYRSVEQAPYRLF